jgi:heme-degrading monooxygenase HmoA
MAFARIAVFPGGTEAHHRTIVEALGDAHLEAEGRILFAAGPTQDGWQILQVWESREQLDRWVEANLGAAFARAGSRGYPAPPRIIDFELSDLMLASNAAST